MKGQSTKKSRNKVKKYATADWNKKTTVRTYSKSRPCSTKPFNYKEFDNVFEPQTPKVAVTEETCGINERPEVRCKVFLKNLEKENNENSNVPYNTVKHGRLYNNEPPYGSCPNESSNLFECTTLGPIKQGRDVVGADSPKNSTCIEGGAAVENAVAAIPFISPIQGAEKTNLNVVSMELTQPCSGKSNKKETNCFSSAGKSSPYILAALSMKKARKAEKFKVMSFIHEKVSRNRLTLPKNYYPEDEDEETIRATRRKQQHEVEGLELKQMTIERKMHSQEPYVAESDQESLDIDPSLLDFSPHIMQISTSSIDLDDIQDTNITPEDKTGPLKEISNAKLRRSLVFQSKHDVPVDMLLLVPDEPIEIIATKRLRKRRRKPSRFPVDVLLF